MEQLRKIGQIKPKKSIDIKKSRIGLGFEKLDRDIFDPEKSYPFVADSGIKWARLQSGWQRTEREKGVYDFSWLDKIVDKMISIGVEPWLCLCYGNDLYTPAAKTVFGAVGCPPINTAEEREAWTSYVKATVTHFKGRIHYYEVWNEPDGQWCWKHGPSADELADFTVATAKACKTADPECEVIGFVTCRAQSEFTKFCVKKVFATISMLYLTTHMVVQMGILKKHINFMITSAKIANPNLKSFRAKAEHSRAPTGAARLQVARGPNLSRQNFCFVTL